MVVVGFMAACRHLDWGFLGVWNGITVFFAVRALQSGSRAIGEHMLKVEQDSHEQRLLELGEVTSSSATLAAGVNDDDEAAGRSIDGAASVSSGESDDEPNFRSVLDNVQQM